MGRLGVVRGQAGRGKGADDLPGTRVLDIGPRCVRCVGRVVAHLHHETPGYPYLASPHLGAPHRTYLLICLELSLVCLGGGGVGFYFIFVFFTLFFCG